MIVYKTPSNEVFHHRQQFHATQKTPNESILDWYKRLQKVINRCEFENVTDYMLIDKFVSGLGDADFEKISQVTTWTIDELILVVIGNAHIFKNSAAKECKPAHDSDILCIKEETSARDDETELNENPQNDPISDSDVEHEYEFIKTDNELPTGENDESTNIKNCRNNSERAKKHIEKLKETGKYDEYKRKKAVSAKKRRLKTKSNEQYLPPELQLLVMNERRRATRERVKRYRDRKQQKSQQTFQLDVDNVSNTDDSSNEVKQPNEAKHLDESMMLDVNIKSKLRPHKSKSIEVIKLEKPKPKAYERKRREFECYLCLLKCKRIYELKTHLKIFHPVEKREVLTCPHCPKITISREVLSRHLKKYHAFLKTHKCPCCDEDFVKRGQLANHLLSHRDYKPFICETCGNGFKTIQQLNSHMRKHTGEKPFKCSECNMLLVSSSSYRSHMLTHTGERPYPCKLCGKEFRQQSSLRKHLISIHNQGEKSHLCTTCNKRFSTIYHLRIHLNVHTGARPYKCKYCDSTFSQPSALKAHIGRIHENESRIRKSDEQNINRNIVLPL